MQLPHASAMLFRLSNKLVATDNLCRDVTRMNHGRLRALSRTALVRRLKSDTFFCCFFFAFLIRNVTKIKGFAGL